MSYPLGSLGIHSTHQILHILYLLTHNVWKFLINNPYCVDIWYFDPHFVSTHFPTISEHQTPPFLTEIYASLLLHFLAELLPRGLQPAFIKEIQ